MAKTQGTVRGAEIPVLVARDRSGQTFDAVLAKRNRASVMAARLGECRHASQPNSVATAARRSSALPVRRKSLAAFYRSRGGPRPEAPNLHAINNVSMVITAAWKEWLRPFSWRGDRVLGHYLGWRQDR